MIFHRLAVPSCLAAIVCAVFGGMAARSAPVVLNPDLQIRLVLKTTNSTGAASVRIAKDLRNNQLYYLKINGDVWQVNLQPGAGSASVRVYTSADHGLSTSVEGFAIGPDGTMYLLGNTTTNGGTANWVRIMKGVPMGAGRVWSLLAQTQPYPLSKTAFDHLYNGIVVSPDGAFLYVNCGSRTDHGEVEDTGGLYPNLRDAPLTAKILRLPVNASNLVLTNDLNVLKTSGYVFAEGTRNAFDLEFAPNGDLFATDNGPDRDMSDELNWIREDQHYGFPWRMGGADNPQQFPNYNPATDLMLDKRFIAVQTGRYHNDPTFPVSPGNFAEPVINTGPNANSFRNPANGVIQVATSGQVVSTFTAHRSPLGLVFDAGAMAPPFQGHGFVLAWTPGDANGDSLAGPFRDASQDLCDLALTKLGTTNYQAAVTRVVGGFSNPIDAEIIGNKIYVIEYGGNMGIWEVTFPPAISLSQPVLTSGGAFQFSVHEPPGLTNTVSASTNLTTWKVLTNFVSPAGPFDFSDPAATNYTRRYYRLNAQ
jgi:hypothetical protein